MVIAGLVVSLSFVDVDCVGILKMLGDHALIPHGLEALGHPLQQGHTAHSVHLNRNTI